MCRRQPYSAQCHLQRWPWIVYRQCSPWGWCGSSPSLFRCSKEVNKDMDGIIVFAVTNVTFSSCVVTHEPHSTQGIYSSGGLRIKSYPNGTGTISNIVYKDIQIHDVAYPLQLQARYCPAGQGSCPSGACRDAMPTALCSSTQSISLESNRRNLSEPPAFFGCVPCRGTLVGVSILLPAP